MLPHSATRRRRSIIPHQDWRGQFARGTYADNGAPTECTSSTDQVGTHINWPGKRTTAWRGQQGPGRGTLVRQPG
jgi:hypothetical protein